MQSKIMDANGNTQSTIAKVAVMPDSGTLWVGHANSHLVMIGKTIVGLHTINGGIIVLCRSTNTISVPAVTNNNDLRAAIQNIIASTNLQSSGWTPVYKQIRLRTLTGMTALVNLNRADPPSAPEVIAVGFQGGNLLVSMKSATGKVIIVILDRQLDPIKAIVDGVITFDKPV